MRFLLVVIIVFTSLFGNSQDTLFWVGASSYWSDIQNWSLSSGGPGGAGIPDSTTDVIFDDQSFNTFSSVIVEAGDTMPVCHHIDFSDITDTVTIAFNSRVINNFYTIPTFRVFGNMRLSPKVKWDRDENILTFTGGDTTNIWTHGVEFATVSVDGPTDKITVFRDAFKSQVLSVTKGIIALENNMNLNLFQAIRRDTTRIILLNKIITAGEWSTETDDAPFSFVVTSGKIVCKNMKPGKFIIFPTVEIDCSLPASISATCGVSYGYGSLANFNKDAVFKNLKLLTPNTIKIIGSIEIIDTFVVNDNVTVQINDRDTLFLPLFKFNQNNGNCTSSFTLSSDLPGTRAYIKNTSTDTLRLVGALVKDMQGVGIVKVSNGRDNGNNANIFFDTIPEPSQIFYWIGGSGSITDVNHWSLTSNGSPAGCLPSYNDNVVFNAASFASNTCPSSCPTLTIPTGIHSYKSMVFNNISNLSINPTYSTSPTIIEIGGSLLFNNTSNVTITQGSNFSWSFTGSNESFIKTDSVDLINVSFTGTAQYRLLSDLLVRSSNINDGNITIGSGKFNTNGYNVNCRDLVITDATEKELVFNTDTIQTDGINFINNATVHESDYTLIASNFLLSLITADTFYQFNRLILKENNILNVKSLSLRHRANFKYLISDATQILHTEGEFNVGEQLVLNKNTAGFSFDTYPFVSTGADTIKLNGDLVFPVSSCAGNFSFYAFDAGTTINLSSTNDSVIFINSFLKDLVPISSSTAFVARNSVLASNAPNWIIQNTTSAKNYYWVGGNGNWNEQSHWSLSSGGPATVCFPGVKDKVVFDNNSNTLLNPVQVEIPLYYEPAIGDLFLINNNKNVSFIGLNQFGNTHVHISDSLLTNDKVSSSRLIMTMTGNQNTYLINQNTSIATTLNIEIQKYAGAMVQLDRKFLSSGSLTLTSGTFKTNNHMVEVGTFTVTGTNSKTLELGTTSLTAGNLSLYNSPLTILSSDYTLKATQAFAGINNHIYHRLFLTNGSELSLNYGSLKFESLYLQGSGEVNMVSGPYFVYDSLVINAGAKLSVDANASLTVEGVIVSNGVSGNLASLKSDDVNIAFNLYCERNQCLQYINIKDCRNNGVGYINAQNSVNGGNTFNISFAVPVDQNKLYWIKGNGIWNNAANWSFSSGSCPSGRVPTATDTVFIDERSTFASVDLITLPAKAFCAGLIIQNFTDTVEIRIGDTLFFNFSKVKYANALFSDGRFRGEEYLRIDSATVVLDNVIGGLNYIPSLVDSIGLNVRSGSTFRLQNLSQLYMLGNKASTSLPAFYLHPNAVFSAQNNTIIGTGLPKAGEAFNDINFSFNGKVHSGSFIIPASISPTQKIRMLSNATIEGSTIINSGNLWLNPGVLFTTR